jgi:hypothetical protein
MPVVALIPPDPPAPTEVAAVVVLPAGLPVVLPPAVPLVPVGVPVAPLEDVPPLLPPAPPAPVPSVPPVVREPVGPESLQAEPKPVASPAHNKINRMDVDMVLPNAAALESLQEFCSKADRSGKLHGGPSHLMPSTR